MFPAAGCGSCAVNVGQAGTVGFSQHIQTFLSLGHLEFISHLHARISREHFPSTISSCGLGFVCFFLSILFYAGGNSQLDTAAVKLSWGGSSWHWDLAGTGFAFSCPCWAGEGSCVPPHQFTRWADWGNWDTGMVWSQTHCWGSSWVSLELDLCVSSAGAVPVHRAPGALQVTAALRGSLWVYPHRIQVVLLC